MKRPNRIRLALTCLSGLVTLAASSGCRNTTNPAISPLGAATPLSPLAPVQGTASLSPIQPTSGMSTFGAPTRVPPPATGSYRSPSTYGTSSNYLAPQAGLPNPIGSFVSTNVPNGALTDAGRTMGVSELTPSIRQTSWVADTNGLLPTTASGPVGGPPASMLQPARDGRGGGMPAIDLTQQPYPPGYVPPQNRPSGIPNSVPFPNAVPSTSFSPASSTNLQPLNPQPWQAAAETPGVISSGGSFGRSFSDMESSPGPLPNNPVPRTASRSNEVQWRTPSPQF